MRTVTEAEISMLRNAADYLRVQPERGWFDPQEQIFRSLLRDVEIDPDFWVSSIDTHLYTARTIEEYVDFVRLLGGTGT